MNYVELYKSESHGGSGSFGLEIKVAATPLPDLETKEIRSATYAAVEIIVAAVKKAIKDNAPVTAKETLTNK